MATIRVLIVDDHRLVAQGMAEVLSSYDDLEVTGLVRTVEAARSAVRRDQPHVVVMDYNLPDGDGVTGTRLLREEHPALKVVMVTGATGPTVTSAALQAGCSGFVTKDRAVDEVVAAVRAAHADEVFISPDAMVHLAGAASRSRRDAGALTPRQLEVLGLLAEGCSLDDIAERLVVSPHTVRNHVQAVIEKLDAHSKLEAVAIALRQGLIAPPGAP